MYYTIFRLDFQSKNKEILKYFILLYVTEIKDLNFTTQLKVCYTYKAFLPKGGEIMAEVNFTLAMVLIIIVTIAIVTKQK